MSEKSGHPGFDHALSDRVIDEIQARPVTSGAVLAEPHEPLAIFDIQLIRIVIFYESTKIRYFCKEPLAKCASILYGAKGCARHHFRAIKSAVSLKPDRWRDSFGRASDFRAIKSAVSLKLVLHAARSSREDAFPRHQKRGLIEAAGLEHELRDGLPISAPSKARSH